MKQFRRLSAILGATSVFLGVGAAHACMSPPNNANDNLGTRVPSITWRSIKSPSPLPGYVRQELYMNVGLFGPSNPTTCACGFGYSGTPLDGLIPLDASLVIYDAGLDQQTPYDVFPTLLPSAAATAAFGQNPGGAGSNWLGFAAHGGSVPAIPIGPPLGNNIFLQVCIRIDVPIAVDALLKQRLGGLLGAEAFPDGTPLPFPEFPHGLDPAAPPFHPDFAQIPAPGAVALLGMAGSSLVRRRR